MVARLGSVLVGREETRRERGGLLRDGRRQRRSEIDALKEADERRERWRRREESRDEEELEWRERLLGMQMEHQKRVMQMHADACQAQIQMLGILVRLACQFLSPAASSGTGRTDDRINGLQHNAMHSSQQQPLQQQLSSGSLVGDNGKNDAHSGEGYL
ncbi:hypothetical protein KSP40_PGU014757 [Platanthera guangdongensis]|uniref:Uncharacterized protein n=1 Tax=Platanthera guangdongensis TaxID=2320717 RepID=A0ABR2M9R4_9ASPA